MGFDAHKDYAYSTVSVAPSPAGSGLSLTVATGEGSRFPNPSTDGAFNVVVWPAGTQNPTWASGGNTGGNFEVLRCTARSSDTLTVSRVQGGSTARTVLVGDQIALADMSKLWTDIERRVPGRKIVDLPTEAVPSTVSNTLYNAFGIHEHFPASGKQILVYREASSHGGTGVFGAIRYRTSTDEGKTWSSPVTIDDGSSHTPNVDLRDVGGGVTRSGRIVIWYGQYNPSHFASPGAGGYPLALGYRYSDDEGKTWSTYTTISTGANDYTFAAHGPTIEIANGRLMQLWYGWTISGGGVGTASLYAIFSDDDGATWGNQVTIVSSVSVEYDESSCAYVGGNYIVVVTRISNGTTFKQFQSADNGATWVAEGSTSFDSWTTPSPPTLKTYTAAGGKRMVACYYTNRDAGTVRVVTASATDLQTTAASAWGSPTTLLSGFTSTDFGYIGVIHPFDTGRGLGSLYKGVSTSQADTVFFLSSLAALTESDIGISDNTTDNVTSSAHGFAPKSPGDATQFLNGAVTPAYAQVKDSDLLTSDVTTNNVSTSKHGFAPKGTGTGTKYLDDTGAYTTPSGGSQWSVLTDGNTSSPALIFDGTGDVIMCQES